MISDKIIIWEEERKMSYCTKCSAELPPNARFCLYCGTPVANNTGARPEKRVRNTTAGMSSTPKASEQNNSITVNEAGRVIKGLICIPIALALITLFVLFFEIDLTQMSYYADIVTWKLYDMQLFVEAAPLLGRIAVYGLAVMIILSAYMLPARLSKTIYKTCSVWDKVRITIAGYYFIALSVYLKTQVIDTGLLGSIFSLLFRVHGADRVKLLAALLVLLVVLLVAVAVIIWSFSVLASVVISNLAVNGPVLGTVAAAYELLSSVFTTALVLCVFSFGVAIILLPFLIMAACSSGRRVAYDEYGNLYYIY